MPTDQELRDEMLQALYEQRHNGDGWVMLPEGLTLLGWNDNIKVNILRQLKDFGLAEWQRTAKGPFAGRARVTPDGVHDIESSQVVIPPEQILEPTVPTAHPTHTQIARYGFWGGLVIAALGVLLFWLGGTGDTSLDAFSILNMKTSNVGLVTCALGVILMALTFRNVLSSLDKSSK